MKFLTLAMFTVCKIFIRLTIHAANKDTVKNMLMLTYFNTIIKLLDLSAQFTNKCSFKCR